MVPKSQYSRLIEILKTTRETPCNHMEPEIQREPVGGHLFLVVRRIHDKKVLARVPLEPGQQDAAAEDIAHRLTLDGGLPGAMT